MLIKVYGIRINDINALWGSFLCLVDCWLYFDSVLIFTMTQSVCLWHKWCVHQFDMSRYYVHGIKKLVFCYGRGLWSISCTNRYFSYHAACNMIQNSDTTICLNLLGLYSITTQYFISVGYSLCYSKVKTMHNKSIN